MGEELMCALCLYELMQPVVMVEAEGLPDGVMYGERMIQWLTTEREPGSWMAINQNSNARLTAVTQIRGTLSCLGHMHQLLNAPWR